jgi:hypothetical protein
MTENDGPHLYLVQLLGILFHRYSRFNSPRRYFGNFGVIPLILYQTSEYSHILNIIAESFSSVQFQRIWKHCITFQNPADSSRTVQKIGIFKIKTAGKVC